VIPEKTIHNKKSTKHNKSKGHSISASINPVQVVNVLNISPLIYFIFGNQINVANILQWHNFSVVQFYTMITTINACTVDYKLQHLPL